VPEYKDHVDALASIMEEFQLIEATYSVGEFHISFSRRRITQPFAPEAGEPEPTPVFAPATHTPEPPAPKGTPIVSPMGGIFYAAPSPGAPPFVKVGDEVTQGQIVGLIEAMKVFNEIPASTSGTVIELVAEPGQVVQIGETLLLFG
jgi:acetyl-CoA carboxylase biotin carboxyl carrier protein